MSTKKPDVIFESINNAGVITLNRPKVHNNLTTRMLSQILPQLQEWEKHKKLVIIKAAGGKAFCVGGDLKSIISETEGQKWAILAYNTFHAAGSYKIPYVALMHGMTMGAGLGLTVHGRYRVATEKTTASMPEVKIGYFTDVGGTHFLPRLRNHLGFYLGLTGERLRGKDIMKAGIATHFVSSNRLGELETQLSRCKSDKEVKSVLGAFNEPSGEFSLAPYLNHINYCFAAPTVEEIIERLERINNDWSVKTVQTLHKNSPGSLKITLRALQRGARLDLAQCLKMEFRIAARAVLSNDFPEGVRARIIDKDNNPQWDPRTLAEVTDDYIESYFKKLSEDTELQIIKSKL